MNTPNRIFGFSRNAVAIIGIIVAIILVVIVGMIIIGSAAIRAMMTPGLKVEGVSLLALLVTIIVLLTAVFTVLLMLLWCCCRGGDKRDTVPPDLLAALLPMLPSLPSIPLALNHTSVALHETAKALRLVQKNLTDAGTFLRTTGNEIAAFNIKVPTFETELFGQFGGFTCYYVKNVNLNNTVHPLGGTNSPIPKALTDAGDKLSSGTIPIAGNNVTVDISVIANHMDTAARDVGRIAAALHSPPPPEVTQ